MNKTKIEKIKKDIENITKLIGSTDKDSQLKYIELVKSAWKTDDFNPLKGLVIYEKYQWDCFVGLYDDVLPTPCCYDWDEDLRRLIGNLEIYIEELEKVIPEQKHDSLVTINNTNTNIVTVTLTQTMQEINKAQLSHEQKQEILQMLVELSELKPNQKKNVWDKVKEIMKWLADKTVDVGIAVLPYLAGIIAK